MDMMNALYYAYIITLLWLFYLYNNCDLYFRNRIYPQLSLWKGTGVYSEETHDIQQSVDYLTNFFRMSGQRENQSRLQPAFTTAFTVAPKCDSVM